MRRSALLYLLPAFFLVLNGCGDSGGGGTGGTGGKGGAAGSSAGGRGGSGGRGGTGGGGTGGARRHGRRDGWCDRGHRWRDGRHGRRDGGNWWRDGWNRRRGRGRDGRHRWCDRGQRRARRHGRRDGRRGRGNGRRGRCDGRRRRRDRRNWRSGRHRYRRRRGGRHGRRRRNGWRCGCGHGRRRRDGWRCGIERRRAVPAAGRPEERAAVWRLVEPTTMPTRGLSATLGGDGPCVTRRSGTGSPPAASGGQWVAGTYDLTSRTVYNRSTAATRLRPSPRDGRGHRQRQQLHGSDFADLGDDATSTERNDHGLGNAGDVRADLSAGRGRGRHRRHLRFQHRRNDVHDPRHERHRLTASRRLHEALTRGAHARETACRARAKRNSETLTRR